MFRSADFYEVIVDERAWVAELSSLTIHSDEGEA